MKATRTGEVRVDAWNYSTGSYSWHARQLRKPSSDWYIGMVLPWMAHPQTVLRPPPHPPHLCDSSVGPSRCRHASRYLADDVSSGGWASRG